MIRFLRNQSQTGLVIILGIMALGFIFYGSTGNLLTSAGNRASNDFGRIDGQDLSVAELYDAIRNTRDALIVQGHAAELSQPGASAQLAEQAWGQLLLLHEADRLHIEVSDKELLDAIHGIPIFQKDGVYNPDVFVSQMGVLQRMLHISPEAGVDPVTTTQTVFENVLRDEIRARAISEALFSTVRNSALDVSSQYQKLSGPVGVSLVTFDPKTFIAAAKVTPEDVAAEYKAHPENPAYRTAEQRRVDYVLFLLTPEQQKLPDAQKVTAKNALGEKALDFALAFQPDPAATDATPPAPPDFLAEAKKRGLDSGTTGFFTAETPPANLPPSPAFNNAAFALSKDNPISKVIELDNGVAVVHLAEIQPSALRPLAEVTPAITQNLQQTKGMQAAQISAGITATALKNAVAKGTDFKTAATGMGLKVDTIPPFVPMSAPQGDPRVQSIAYASTTLAPGEVSNPIPMPGGGGTLIMHIDSRTPADPAGLAAFETRFRSRSDEQLREMAYTDWVTWKDKQPGTHKPPDLDAYGSVE